MLNAADPSLTGEEVDAFVAKFSPTGELLWSTYVGGSEDEFYPQVTVDGESNVIFSCTSESPDFQASPSLNSGLTGWKDVIVAKYDENGTRLWGRYLGGLLADYGSQERHYVLSGGARPCEDVGQ